MTSRIVVTLHTPDTPDDTAFADLSLLKARIEAAVKDAFIDITHVEVTLDKPPTRSLADTTHAENVAAVATAMAGVAWGRNLADPMVESQHMAQLELAQHIATAITDVEASGYTFDGGWYDLVDALVTEAARSPHPRWEPWAVIVRQKLAANPTWGFWEAA